MSSASPRSTAPNTTSGRGILRATISSSTGGAACFRTSACAPRRRTPSTARPSIRRCITGRGRCLDQCYPKGDPWYLEGIRSLEYDPDRAKAMLKEARAVGTAVKIIANTNLSIARETVQVIQEAVEHRRVQGDHGAPRYVPLSLPPGGRAHFDAGFRATPTASTRMTFMRAICTPRASGVGATVGWHNERYDQLGGRGQTDA